MMSLTYSIVMWLWPTTVIGLMRGGGSFGIGKEGLGCHFGDIPSSTHPYISVVHNYHISSSSSLKLLLVNGRSLRNKPSIIHDLLMNENTHVAYVTEIWVGENLSALCLPGFLIQLQPKLDVQGCVVIVIYTYEILLTRCWNTSHPAFI